MNGTENKMELLACEVFDSLTIINTASIGGLALKLGCSAKTVKGALLERPEWFTVTKHTVRIRYHHCPQKGGNLSACVISPISGGVPDSPQEAEPLITGGHDSTDSPYSDQIS